MFEVAVQLLVVLVQFVQTYVVGPFEHDAVSAMFCPTVGAVLLAEIVHAGGAVADCCQLTVAEAGGLLPAELVATTEYVTLPEALEFALHVLVVLEQPCHAYVVEASVFVHDAVSVTFVPITGEVLLVLSVHEGAAPPPPPPPPLPPQFTVR